MPPPAFGVSVLEQVALAITKTAATHHPYISRGIATLLRTASGTDSWSSRRPNALRDHIVSLRVRNAQSDSGCGALDRCSERIDRLQVTQGNLGCVEI